MSTDHVPASQEVLDSLDFEHELMCAWRLTHCPHHHPVCPGNGGPEAPADLLIGVRTDHDPLDGRSQLFPVCRGCWQQLCALGTAHCPHCHRQIPLGAFFQIKEILR